jgi:hypothetical protein
MPEHPVSETTEKESREMAAAILADGAADMPVERLIHHCRYLLDHSGSLKEEGGYTLLQRTLAGLRAYWVLLTDLEQFAHPALRTLSAAQRATLHEGLSSLAEKREPAPAYEDAMLWEVMRTPLMPRAGRVDDLDPLGRRSIEDALAYARERAEGLVWKPHQTIAHPSDAYIYNYGGVFEREGKTYARCMTVAEHATDPLTSERWFPQEECFDPNHASQHLSQQLIQDLEGRDPKKAN